MWPSCDSHVGQKQLWILLTDCDLWTTYVFLGWNCALRIGEGKWKRRSISPVEISQSRTFQSVEELSSLRPLRFQLGRGREGTMEAGGHCVLLYNSNEICCIFLSLLQILITICIRQVYYCSIRGQFSIIFHNVKYWPQHGQSLQKLANLRKVMGWMWPLSNLAMPRVMKSQTAILPSLQPTASSVPLRLNAHVRASLPESRIPSLCWGGEEYTRS